MTHPSTLRWYDAHGRAHSGPDADPQGVYLELLDSVGRRLGEVDDLVRGDEQGAGWTALLDPERTPSPAYLGQFVGVRIPGGATDAQARALVVEQPATKRGTVGALQAAARALLTGSKHVEVLERTTSAYALTVRTNEDETPNPAAVDAALQDAKPAGLVLTYRVVSRTPYSEHEAEPAETYNAYEATPAATYDALEAS